MQTTDATVLPFALIAQNQLKSPKAQLRKSQYKDQISFVLENDVVRAEFVALRRQMVSLRRLGFPANDHDVLDSYRLETADKSTTYERLLRELPEGLSEWAIHPGIGNSELRAMEPITWDVRQADFDFFTSSQAREIIQKEGILVLDYRPIQKLWQTM